MDRYEKSAEFIMKRGDAIIAERKRRKSMILRSCALGAGAATILGIGIFANALKPPQKPTAESSGIITNTEAVTTYAESTVQTTAKSVTTQKQSTVVTSAHTETATSKAIVSSITTGVITSATVTVYTQTPILNSGVAPDISTGTETAVTTQYEWEPTDVVNTKIPPYSTQAITYAPQTTTVTTTKALSIDQRIANINIAFPLFDSYLKQIPVINENGEKIPTFAMLVDESNYECIFRYQKGDLPFTLDINADGTVDLCDMLEITAYLESGEEERMLVFPDMSICERIEEISYIQDRFTVNSELMPLIPEYMIFCDEDIPETKEIMATLKSYAGKRSIPDKAYTLLCQSVESTKEKYDRKYKKMYDTLNQPVTFSESELDIYRKLDSGELFPDYNHDGNIDYIDAYGMLEFFSDVAIGNEHNYSEEELKWIHEKCDIYDQPQMPGAVNSSDVSLLLRYLFRYKGLDYVTNIEMEVKTKYN